jgi:DNA mismatch endonuclease, patch repair protein
MANSVGKDQAASRSQGVIRKQHSRKRKLQPPAAASAEPPVTAERSRIMRSIGQKHTKPELLVRKVIHAMGFRFRLHQRGLPGRPDIVMRGHSVIVQVHGCFWHRHGCSISNIPRTRKDYWIPKLARNVERDKANDLLLRSMGWRVITVWECEAKDEATLSNKLRKLLGCGRGHATFPSERRHGRPSTKNFR